MSPSTPPHAIVTALQLGQQLKSARLERQLTQTDLAVRVGLSQNRLSHLERHAEQLSVQQLLAWCAAVGLELSLGERPAAPSAQASSNSTVPEW
jgi:HTH-type transcriptional regulator/antitoxin HipB